MRELNLLRLDNVPILKQLQIEEALLRADQDNWCILNAGSPPAIVMGISGKPQALIDQKLIKTHPLPIIRRFSGGGTVIVDEHTLFVTLIGHASLIEGPCFPDRLLSWTERLYSPAFQGIDFKLKENDYVSGNKKFGGNAQYLCKNRWLHHSSLLWDFQEERMQYLLMPPKMPHYRDKRPHGEFLCRLKDFYPARSTVVHNLLSALKKHFEIREVPHSVVDRILAKDHRKATILECADSVSAFPGATLSR